MSRFMGLRHRLRALLFPRAHAQDIADEMELHLDLERMHRATSAKRQCASATGPTTRKRYAA